MKMKFLGLLGAGLLAGPISANATTISQIIMGGVDLNYNEANGWVCDSGGGVGCFGTADSLFTMTFVVNGVAQGTYVSNIGINILLYIAPGTSPTTNATSSVLSSSFDIFDAQINSGPGLFTDVTTGNVTFTNSGINLGGTGFANIVAQSLPFGMVAGDPINWSFSSGSSRCTGTVGQRVCTYSGSGELSWEQNDVPEPGSLALLGLGLMGLGLTRRRKTA